jgi:Glycine-rich domain
MRIELAGSLVHPDPLVLRFTSNQNLDISHYIGLQYTHFDVICIGAGGGMGGGIDTANTGTLVRSYGGAGGGGGFQRVRGLLSALPSTCPIVVGAGGSLGTEHASNPALTTDGGDGGFSSFNNTTCRASGGRGGKRVQANSLTVSTQANGGDGGVGNRTTAGGGAAGGVAGTPTATGPGTLGTAGTDGTFLYDPINQSVGQGGGGGAGGVGKYPAPGTTCNAATNGGRGTYNPGDTSVYGPGDTPNNDPSSGSQNVIPGGASGAKASPLNGIPTVYGQSKGERLVGDPGIVIIRLTAE